MPHNIAKLTHEIRQSLPEVESNIDTALLSISGLMTTLINARIESGAPAGTGHRALLELVKAQEAVVIASASLAKAHTVMVGVGREVGAHDIDKCPPAKGKDDPVLRAVA